MQGLPAASWARPQCPHAASRWLDPPACSAEITSQGPHSTQPMCCCCTTSDHAARSCPLSSISLPPDTRGMSKRNWSSRRLQRAQHDTCCNTMLVMVLAHVTQLSSTVHLGVLYLVRHTCSELSSWCSVWHSSVLKCWVCMTRLKRSNWPKSSTALWELPGSRPASHESRNSMTGSQFRQHGGFSSADCQQQDPGNRAQWSLGTRNPTLLHACRRGINIRCQAEPVCVRQWPQTAAHVDCCPCSICGHAS